MTFPRNGDRIRQILSDTIGLLCKNGFSFEVELSVDALIGITIDHQEVILVSIKDSFESEKCLAPFENSINSSSLNKTQETKDQVKPNSLNRNATRIRSRSSTLDDLKNVEKQDVVGHPLVMDSCHQSIEICEDSAATSDSNGRFNKRARIVDEKEICTLNNHHLQTLNTKPDLPADLSLVTGSNMKSSTNRIQNFTTETAFRGTCNDLTALNEEVESSKSSNEDHRSVFCSKKQIASISSPSSNFPDEENKNCSPLSPVLNVTSQNLDDQRELSENRTDEALEISLHQTTHPKLPPNSNPSNFLTTKNESYCHKSDEIVHQRRTDETFYDSHFESLSSSGDVICIKDEPASPSPSDFNRISSSFHRLDTDLDEVLSSTSPNDGFRLEAVSFDQLTGWRDAQNSFVHGAKRCRRESAFSHDHLMPLGFNDHGAQFILVVQSILLYDGRYVPLRDLQRLRLCGIAAGRIKFAMERLSSYEGKLGLFQVLHGGVNLFYKCPPSLVDRQSLELHYGISWEKYKFHYDVVPASNITTRHNEQYWLKVATSSPYVAQTNDC